MGMYRPLRAGICLYDIIRLWVMLQETLRSAPFPLGSEPRLPPVLLIAPNALFPLAALWLYAAFEACRPCLWLYIAGKLIAVAAGLSWLVFALINLSPSPLEDMAAMLLALGLTVLVLVMDSLSIAGSVFINRRLQTSPIEPAGEPSRPPAAEREPQNGGI